MNTFTIFMKNGGTNSMVTEKWWREKTALFDLLSAKEFTYIPLQFHIELRVNGEYVLFGDIEGCNNLRFMKTKSLIANSITCTPSKYNDDELLLLLNKNLSIAFTQIIERLKKDKIYINAEQLMSCL